MTQLPDNLLAFFVLNFSTLTFCYGFLSYALLYFLGFCCLVVGAFASQ